MDPAPSPFLALPVQIRKRIYRFAHLRRPCPILIVPRSRAAAGSPACDPSSGPFCSSPESSPEWALERHLLLGEKTCKCPALPKQLLLVNKAIHKEAQEVLYGENAFAICAHGSEDFQALKMLSSDALGTLRRLVIRINIAPLLHDHDDENSLCLICRAPVSSTHSQSMLQEWTLVCQLLARSLAPAHLKLDLINNIRDLPTIRQLLGSLNSLPRLLDCHIWMGKRLDPSILSLSRSTAVELVTKLSSDFESKPRKPQASLALLPPEIRRRIFMFANLGYNEPFEYNGKEICVKDGKFTPSLNLQCYHGYCQKCSTFGVRCHCRFKSEWQSFSAHCQGRDLPLGLFLTSWQMYAEGAGVLYSTNTFTFSGSFQETLNMLQSFRPETLRLFRRIRFEIDFEQTKAWDKHEIAFLSLFSFIGKYFDVPQLLLIIDTSQDYFPSQERGFGEPSMKRLYDSYVSIMRWVKFSLSGLADLHVTLGMFFDLEPEFERYVMGPEYDSRRGNRFAKAERGKIHPARSNWEKASAIPYWHRPL
ncbi:unnamed protein product [Clonostachys rosea]|uniref:DUF7730 domain-containing protein n=1 Tax=Bionectria ochroleuca TaxID=29856 RepID=A0ABY6V520_BIOOC|nr:unnamed protein product [Clonostachys rosea]